MYSKSCSVFLNLVALLLICTEDIRGAELPKSPCTAVGEVCNDDCTAIVLCTIVGQEPITTVETCGINNAGQQTYCSSTTPDCSSLEPNCGNIQKIEVKCAVYGEFPHPAKCGSTVRCSEDSTGTVIEKPTSICNCPNNKFVNFDSPDLPCSDTTCSYEPVKCEKAGQTGRLQESKVFCYTCAGTETVFVHYCFDFKNWNPLDFSRANDGKTCQANP